MYNFVSRLKFFIYCPWFSRNNSISGATSLKALRKDFLPLHKKGKLETLFYEPLILESRLKPPTYRQDSKLEKGFDLF